MKYLNETETRQLAENDELVLHRWNGIWVCGQGAVFLPVHFALTVNSVSLRYDGSWRAVFSFAENEEFVVECAEYETLTTALYDIGMVMAAWLEDVNFTQVISVSFWKMAREVIAFLAANADNNEPLPEHLIDMVRELDTPSALTALLKVQNWRGKE